MAKLISVDAGNLIIEQEVSGRVAYNKKYQRPERPGGQSGITVGIGYDCGYSTAAQIRKDWGERIPAAMVSVLCGVAGLKGSAAQNALAAVQPKVVVPWDAAIDEFYSVEVPRWLAKVRAALPNLDLLPPDCIGALVSLAYNRGVSFTIPPSQDRNGRYAEMRAIRARMVAKQFAAIPTEFRKMKRLWVTASVRGVATRREAEARLFERGLKQGMPAAVAAFEETPIDDAVAVDAQPGSQANGDVSGEAGLAKTEDTASPATDAAAVDNPGLYAVKRRLKAMNYNCGVLNGEWGGMTAGAIAGFVNDRGGNIAAPASLDAFNAVRGDLEAELSLAESEKPPFVRPVSAARASGDLETVAKVAPEVVPVRRNFLLTAWTAAGTFFAGVANAVSGYIAQAWDFFTDHRDDIPSDPGMLSTAWEYLGHVPALLWWTLAAVGIGFVAFNSWSGVKKITEQVKTGARQ